MLCLCCWIMWLSVLLKNPTLNNLSKIIKQPKRHCKHIGYLWNLSGQSDPERYGMRTAGDPPAVVPGPSLAVLRFLLVWRNSQPLLLSMCLMSSLHLVSISPNVQPGHLGPIVKVICITTAARSPLLWEYWAFLTKRRQVAQPVSVHFKRRRPRWEYFYKRKKQDLMKDQT